MNNLLLKTNEFSWERQRPARFEILHTRLSRLLPMEGYTEGDHDIGGMSGPPTPSSTFAHKQCCYPVH